MRGPSPPMPRAQRGLPTSAAPSLRAQTPDASARPHASLLAAGDTRQQHAEGLAVPCLQPLLAQHTEGTDQRAQGRFCSVSRGRPRTSARSNARGAARKQLDFFPPLAGPCGVSHPPALAEHGRAVPRGRAAPSPWLCFHRGEKRAVISTEQVREPHVLPYCTINHEKFSLLSCMKRNLAGRSDHGDVLLARRRKARPHLARR